eukprot:CAMPEP_0170197002 /NCGR_PEP_ID=MMETSP0040_2-20121228/65348_1 /TAXON_ID=641309 /ORGANISM="Lotharella oceanica, Strain CCMP622" /LENGTH=133 /DNA_ID=CAMNT_0010446589 /DNA_START=203 /DNA_END=601 /DNA_ORIENTATION=+
MTPGNGSRPVPPKAAKEIIIQIPPETLGRLCIPLLIAPDIKDDDMKDDDMKDDMKDHIKEPLPKKQGASKVRFSVTSEQMRATFSIGVSPEARREAVNVLFLGAHLPGDGPSLSEAAAKAVRACDSAVRAKIG